jgi:putative transposase
MVGHNAVALLLRRAGLAGATRGARNGAMPSPTRSPTTWSTATSPARAEPAVGDRQHRAPDPRGKLYCAVVLDTCSRRVVGWSIDATPTAGLVTNALGMAIQTRTPPGGTVIHADTAGAPRRAGECDLCVPGDLL